MFSGGGGAGCITIRLQARPGSRSVCASSTIGPACLTRNVSQSMSALHEAPSKSVAGMLALAIEAGCLTSRDYIPWADDIIARLDHPPVWICELSTTEHCPEALRVIHAFLRSEPFAQGNVVAEDYLGFLWIQYERRELSWATFLKEAGQYSDAANGAIDCGYFYSMLNDLEEAEYDSSVEIRQRERVRQRLADAIIRTRGFYENIRKRG
jgi:hypothetical protein